MPNTGRPPTRHLLLAVAALGLIVAAWRAGAAATSPAPAPVAPTAVAVADFKRVYEALKETEDRAARLTSMQTKFQDDLNGLATQLESMKRDIDTAKVGSKERRELVIAMNEADVAARAKKEGYTTRLTLTAGDNTRDIYQKFLGTLDFMAKQQGWDLILLDDRAIALPETAPNDQITGTITSKKTLYVGPRVDITDQVITQMNNDYAMSPPTDRTPLPPPPTVGKQ